MKIAITGANGFLGSNLTKLFLKEGFDILAISRSDNNLKGLNIQYAKELTEKLVSSFEPDAFIHCAWSGGNNYNDADSFQQFVNIDQGIEILKIISNLNKKPHFIGFGSFAEYGKLKDRALETQREEPINFYGVSKNNFMQISKVHTNMHNMKWTWIRPCYVYGPSDVPTRLIPSIINKILSFEEIKIYDDGTKIDYIYIEDFCSAILNLIKNKSEGVFNICSGEEYEISNVIKMIIEKSNLKANIVYDESLTRKYTSNYICGSNEKLRSTINWNPSYSIEEGIEKTINYYKNI